MRIYGTSGESASFRLDALGSLPVHAFAEAVRRHGATKSLAQLLWCTEK